MVIYKHINRGHNTLLLFFNNMVHVGYDDTFSCYHLLQEIFPFDILFVKDICHGQWYLSIMEECRTLVNNIISENKYEHVFGLTDSAGTIPLLNIAPHLSIFREGIIINGQTSLKQEIVDKYRLSCRDCVIFDHSKLSYINDIYLSPLENLSETQLRKFRYYYNDSASDYQYYLYTSRLYEHFEKKHVNLETDGEFHASYIGKFYSNKSLMQSIVSTWLSMMGPK